MTEVVNQSDSKDKKADSHTIDVAALAKMSLERLLYYVLVELPGRHAIIQSR